MRDLCNTDKPLFAVLTKLTYSAYLNILWLVCSLPIVTIGASTTALFYVTLKMAEDRDDGLTRMFFKAFRENFKPATKLWLILLAVGSFLAADGFVLRRMWSENIFWTLLTAVLIGAAVLYGIVLLYAFPLLARFENTTFGILKTAFLVGVRYLFCTLLMAALGFTLDNKCDLETYIAGAKPCLYKGDAEAIQSLITGTFTESEIFIDGQWKYPAGAFHGAEGGPC